MTSADDRSALPRRTINELVTMYELEPDLRDIFVEGPRDRTFYSWYFRRCGYKDSKVLEIDFVEITRETLEAYGLGSGNRARVIALALELDSRFTSVLRFVRCIADSDYDFVLASRIWARHLYYTDYTSVDLYAYEEELLSKVLCLGFNHSEHQVRSLLESITPILLEVFTIRAANEKLTWGMNILEFTRCCKVQGSRIIFDRDVFVKRCLNANSRHGERTMFERVCGEIKTVQLNEPRKGIRGSDYFELLGWYLKQRCGWRGYSKGKRSVISILLPALDNRALFNEQMFIELNTVLG